MMLKYMTLTSTELFSIFFFWKEKENLDLLMNISCICLKINFTTHRFIRLAQVWHFLYFFFIQGCRYLACLANPHLFVTSSFEPRNWINSDRDMPWEKVIIHSQFFFISRNKQTNIKGAWHFAWLFSDWFTPCAKTLSPPH